MPYNPDKQIKLYYNISEVAEMIGVTETLLRYWEKEFKNIHPRKSSRNVRQYTKEDIEQVRKVYHLVKEKGLTLEGARLALKNGKDGSSQAAEVIDRLQLLREELVSIRKELDGIV
ncbi:MAG: MerR family transcriptional regulator [Bacteroidaceae bacterium]|nr:MerR family transcriptional regulator [Bacteroidaceae bacterium]